MAVRGKPPIARHKGEASCPTAELVGRMLSQYVDWREHAAAVGDAYRYWSAAPAADEAWRFSAYLAALDLEASSAGGYALAMADGTAR
jgi:hypothetical protein